jgi:hypothetical protein
MKSRYLFLFLLLFGFSCNHGQHGGFTIRGQFSNASGQKVVLCEMGVKEVVALDSANISKEGNVSFSHPLDQPGFYLLIFPDGRRITLVMKSGEDLQISGNLNDPAGDLRYSGSEETVLLQDFFRANLKNKARIDSVKRKLLSREGSEDFLKFGMTADSLFFRISGDQKKLEKDFIDRHPDALSSLIVLNYSFGPKPVLTLEEDLPYYRKLTGLHRIYPENKHVIYHLERVSLFLDSKKHPSN